MAPLHRSSANDQRKATRVEYKKPSRKDSNMARALVSILSVVPALLYSDVKPLFLLKKRIRKLQLKAKININKNYTVTTGSFETVSKRGKPNMLGFHYSTGSLGTELYDWKRQVW